MSHSDANCAKPRTSFRCRPADPWKLGARSLPEQQPPPARAPGGPFLIESAILSFPLHPLRPHNARAHARAEHIVVGLLAVIVAWDFSRPATRAVADAMPILEKAKRVCVLTVTKEKVIDTRRSGAELAKHLARHGVD